jgi:hypothetical protein
MYTYECDRPARVVTLLALLYVFAHDSAEQVSGLTVTASNVEKKKSEACERQVIFPYMQLIVTDIHLHISVTHIP